MSTTVTGMFLAGLAAGFGVAIPVGAIAVLVMGLAAQNSFRVGAAAALGVATADGLYAAVAALGGAALAAVLAPVAGPLRVVAAVVLLALAAYTAGRALRSARPTAVADANPGAEARSDDPAAASASPARRRGLETPPRAFAGVLALTLLNPATVVYFAALVLGRQDSAAPALSIAGAFVLGAFLASASWQLLVAGGGTLVGRILTGPRGRLGTALVSSTIIAALAVTMLLAAGPDVG
ncbi:LysE family transporter [Salinispora arenicola]|uniref:LysE family transporter n=1 Tax=Salinispora arenicola TaxID=168697 RepID=UPI00035DCD1B|nr:LysE family transporter [Salinispora arenicola]NIL60441.1 LysE family transporter [Salinispora arenicola]